MSKSNFETPQFLRPPTVLERVNNTRPDDEAGSDLVSNFDRLIVAFKDMIHSITNNTIRTAGVALSGADSEQTADWASTFGDKIEEFIRSEWSMQDRVAEAEKNNEGELRRYLALVNEARRRNGRPEVYIVSE
jgi:hypothetical protein